MSTIILYHANCPDGLGSAYAAYEHYGNTATYQPVSYSDPFNAEDYRDKDVYVLDFSFKRKQYLQLLEVAKSVIVLDHHKSAHEEIGDLVKIDQTKSGARLAWEYFHPNTDVPLIILRIEDRDLWLYKYTDTKAVNAWMSIYTQGLTPEAFSDLIDTTSYDKIVSLGTPVVNYIEAQAKAVSSGYWLTVLSGHVVPVVNCPPGLTSVVGEILAKEHTFSVSYSDKYPLRTVSLRSIGKFDVSAIAKQYGGGGHRNAAGFTINMNETFDLFK